MKEVEAASVDRSHPRYESLKRREALISGYREGLVAPHGLIAHGRGEMFDYVLGEATLPAALESERAAAAALLRAKRPVISVNGNLATLCPGDIAALSKSTKSTIEVNLFHWSKERATLIRKHLESNGCREVLAENPDALLVGIHHDRGRCHKAGIFSADVVLIPLEDGDRAGALATMGKTIISIDLNPISRTSLAASISVVDEVTRAMPNIVGFSETLSGSDEQTDEILAKYSNEATLRSVCAHISERFRGLPADLPGRRA